MGHFSWYQQLPFYDALVAWLRANGVIGPEHGITHVFSSTLVVLILLIIGIYVRSHYAGGEDRTVPSPKTGLLNIVEVGVDMLRNLVRSIITHRPDQYFPLLGGVFIFVFVNNVLGLIPGFPPATTTVSTNLAIGLTIFLYYNYRGFATSGPGYIKHFMGPVWWLAPLMFVIELISHAVRPISLSLRLAGNITGDHMVIGVFGDLTYVLIPVIFMFLGLFVCFIQAFVFTMLSSVYIAMATSHDH